MAAQPTHGGPAAEASSGSATTKPAAAAKSAGATSALWFAATTLLGAFLVFQVQPVISKCVLPWFGGTPAVWTTCMLCHGEVARLKPHPSRLTQFYAFVSAIGGVLVAVTCPLLGDHFAELPITPAVVAVFAFVLLVVCQGWSRSTYDWTAGGAAWARRSRCCKNVRRR